ncbi:MAG: hypothetical protein KY443_00115 [Actinobacteria bacterium]|nr:hypothetical protein [Actinomycetota bacterium]
MIVEMPDAGNAALVPAILDRVRQLAATRINEDVSPIWFADTLAMATPVSVLAGNGFQELLRVAGSAQLLLAFQGVLTRGTITVAPHALANRFVGGPGLDEVQDVIAADTRPCIELTPSAADFAHAHVRGPKAPRTQGDSLLVVDDRGVALVNYLATAPLVAGAGQSVEAVVEDHRDHVAYGLGATFGDDLAWGRYEWAAGYHNAWCAEQGLLELALPAVPTTHDFTFLT